jgi:hypothetical protein
MVTEQGHIFLHFRIHLFGNPEDKRSRALCAANPRSCEMRHTFEVRLRSRRKPSHGPRCGLGASFRLSQFRYFDISEFRESKGQENRHQNS